MKTKLLISVLSISLLMPGLCASGITGKLSYAKLTALASTVRGRTTSVWKDVKDLFIPVIALAITYEKVIKPGSIVVCTEINNLLHSSSEKFEKGPLSWFISKPAKLLSALWKLPLTCKVDKFVNFLQNKANPEKTSGNIDVQLQIGDKN